MKLKFILPTHKHFVPGDHSSHTVLEANPEGFFFNPLSKINAGLFTYTLC